MQPVKTKKKLSRADKKQIEAAIARANRTDKKGKSAQDSIPYERMWPDGICRILDSHYTKTIQFQDINYQLSQNEDKTAIFEGWCDFLNYFDSSIHFQLSFLNLAASEETFANSISIPPQRDAFDSIREEYTTMLQNQLARGNNGLIKTKYLTFGIDADSIKAAKPNAMPTAAPQRRRIWRQVVRYSLRSAAAVILMIGAAYTGKTLYRNALSQQNMSIVVPAGQQMSLTLPDNSQVQLNSGTRLEYPVVFGKTRSVKLSGEALFDVAPDRKHPFIVQTFASDIRVLGTKFNVLADAERGEFTTTLIEGQVQVTNRANSNERITMYPHDVVSLSNGRLYKERAEDFAELCWTEGLVHLKRMPFDELMAKFERAFNVEIRIECERMPQINVMSGEVRISDGVDYALQILQQVSTGFSYTRDEKTNVIVIK